MANQFTDADTGRPSFNEGRIKCLARAIENTSHPEAIDIMTKGVTDDPSVKPPLSTLRHLVIHWMERGRWRKALACANRLLLRTHAYGDENAYDFRFNAAKAHFNLCHYPRALELADRAYEIAKKRKDQLLALHALRLRQEAEMAMERYEAAVASEREMRALVRWYGVSPEDIPAESAATSEDVYFTLQEEDEEPITVRYERIAV